MDNFEEVFDNKNPGRLLNGHETMSFEIDLQSIYFSDRSDDSGSFW